VRENSNLVCSQRITSQQRNLPALLACVVAFILLESIAFDLAMQPKGLPEGVDLIHHHNGEKREASINLEM
jgi:hypothetical protein